MQMILDDPQLYARGIPHDVYDALRSKGGVHFSPGANPFHAVVGYVDAVTVLQNPTLYSSERRGILIEDAAPAVVPFMRAMLPVLDPPAHTALRSALQPPLLGGHVARFREQLATLCCEVVDRALDAGEIDFVHSVAAEIPLLSFGLLMGLDRGEIEPLRAPSDAIIENGINESIPQVEQLCARLDALVVERQRRPRDDYLSQIARLDLAARPLERTERNGLLLQLVIGGLDTTRTAIAGLLAALAEHPDQWRQLRANPSGIGNAVEESLRYITPVNYLRRTTTAPAQLGCFALPADARVVVFLGAANRDPARFADPHRLDLTRSNARLHLAFGSGPHFCMGAALARLQLVSFWSAFTSRVSEFALTGTIRRRVHVQQNLIKTLPVRLKAA
jgi:cytochrome P450